MLELKKIKAEEAHIRLVRLESFFYGKYFSTVTLHLNINNKYVKYLSLCLYNDELCYLYHTKSILNAFDNNLNCISFDVVLKDISGVGIFPDYESITNISNEYDFHYLQKLSHSVDEKDNIKIMYERLTKHNISDQYVQKQLAEFTAIEREYKLKQLIDTF